MRMLKYLFLEQTTTIGQVRAMVKNDLREKLKTSSEKIEILRIYHEKDYRIYPLEHEDERRLFQIFQDNADASQLIVEIKNSEHVVEKSFEQYYEQLSQKCDIKFVPDNSLRDFVHNFENLRNEDASITFAPHNTYMDVIQKIKEILKPCLKQEIDYDKLYLLRKKKGYPVQEIPYPIDVRDRSKPLSELSDDCTEIRYAYQPHLKVWERNEKIIVSVSYFDHQRMSSSPVFKIPTKKDSILQELIVQTKSHPDFEPFWTKNPSLRIEDVKIALIEQDQPSKIHKLLNNQTLKINQFLKKRDQIFRIDFLRNPQSLPLEKDRVTFLFSHFTKNEEDAFGTPFLLTFSKQDTIDKIFMQIASLLDNRELAYKEKVYQIKMENLKITAYTDQKMNERQFLIEPSNSINLYLVTDKDSDLNTNYYCTIQHSHITTREEALKLKIN